MFGFLVSLMIVAATGTDAQEPDVTLLERAAIAGTRAVLSHVLEAPVNLDRLELDPKKQVLIIRNLTIGNPHGFKTGFAIRIGEIRIEGDHKKLFAKSPEMQAVKIDDVEIYAQSDPAH